MKSVKKPKHLDGGTGTLTSTSSGFESNSHGISINRILSLLLAIFMFSVTINIVAIGSAPKAAKEDTPLLARSSTVSEVGAATNNNNNINNIHSSNNVRVESHPHINLITNPPSLNFDHTSSAELVQRQKQQQQHPLHEGHATGEIPNWNIPPNPEGKEEIIMVDKSIPSPKLALRSNNREQQYQQQHRRQIEYGIFNKHPKRVPVVMIRTKLSKDVHDRFLQSPLFQCTTEDEMNANGLKKTVDYPKSKDTHTYYEGYYHAVSHVSDTVFSRNPRTGKDFNKMPAGDFIRAFYHSLRDINKDIFQSLASKLYASALTRMPNNPHNDSCGYVAKWLSKGLHFADLSVQIHWGSAIKGDELFWHSDAENSLLHFGLTVKGERILHSKRAPFEDGDVKEILESQQPGDVYLSSSALMNHAPEYPKTDFSTRIVAIQSRILYETPELQSFRDQRTSDAWTALVKILADHLSTSELKLPTLQDISDAMA